MPVDLDWSKASDTVGQEFDANYVPGVTRERYEASKSFMERLLEKYGGIEGLMANKKEYDIYKRHLYIAHSYAKDEADRAIQDVKLRRERKNTLSSFFETHPDLELPKFARDAIIKYTESGLLRGLENLESLYRRSDNPREKFNNLGNELYNVLGYMHNPPPVMILPSGRCGKDWMFLGDTQYVS